MGQRKILCIEPDAAQVADIRSAFAAYGYEIESIPNGDQAIEWARTNPPALVILSVEPRKVGYAVCNKIKRSPSLREIPLVLISSEETEATFDQHKKLKSRADEYLLKPFSAEELLAKVEPFLSLSSAPVDEIQEADSGDIVLADDDLATEDERESGHDEGRDTDRPVTHKAADTLAMLDDVLDGPGSLGGAGSVSLGSSGETPFDAEQFDRETQAAFAALEAGAAEGGTPGPTPATPPPASPKAEPDLGNLWSDDIATRLGWDEPPAASVPDLAAFLAAPSVAAKPSSDLAAAEITREEAPPPSLIEEEISQAEFDVAPGTSPSMSALLDDLRSEGGAPAEPVPLPSFLLGGDGPTADVPPTPEDIEYPEVPAVDETKLLELQAAVERLAQDKAGLERELARRDQEQARAEEERARRDEERAKKEHELQGRIGALESERGTLRKDIEDLRERLAHSAQQGTFSKEREFLGLREIINKKEKDILDLRDALDAKEREILDRKDKIREHERARRDLEERTLGFEKSLVAANEKAAELMQDKEKSVERERGLKARLDDAHEEIRKAQEEIEGLRRRLAQTDERGRAELERVRAELEGKLHEAEDAHRAALAKAADERAASEEGLTSTHQAELSRAESVHRQELEALQKRMTEELAAAAEKLQSETSRLRKEQEKALASLKEEQALQLAAERQSYETSTEQKERAHRDELVAMRRRHEEELSKAEERRQRDIAEYEARRVSELEQSESRRRVELQTRDEEHHARVTEIERRHLMEKAEMAERYRVEQDQALGRAARAEGELAARLQELEQANRRGAGLEADLNVTRAELGDRAVKLGQAKDRIGELEAKVADYEEQIMRAYQKLRTEEKTSEKVRRALTVAFALMDERAAAVAAVGASTPSAAKLLGDEPAEQKS